MAIIRLSLGAALAGAAMLYHTTTASPVGGVFSRADGPAHHSRRNANDTGSGVVQLAVFNCAAFVWDDINYSYAFLPGYATAEQAETNALAQCKDGEAQESCEVKVSWCSDKCVAVAFSIDWQWYAYNPNPVSATKAAMYALNKCTQSVCDAPAWADRCNSAAPVCYIEAIICGTEYITLNNYTTGETIIGGTFDTVNDNSEPLVFTSNVTILSQANYIDVEANITLPIDPLPVVVPADLTPSETDPGYIADGTSTATTTTTGAAAATTEAIAVDTTAAAEPAATTEAANLPEAATTSATKPATAATSAAKPAATSA